MIRLVSRDSRRKAGDATLTLPFEKRTRGRLRVVLDDGREAGLFLDRGPILRDGDCLVSEEGLCVRIVAAPETVSCVRCEDGLLLARAAYHLGNRHVALQVGAGELRYRHDHVLDDMVRGLGLDPLCLELPFEPEPGAYGEHHADHDHGHTH